ncbi:hypothetical protein LJC64_05620, partial [Ruminococcaceae bacterium OttesenSCG-928-A11]|nr:hypothetical protein [Ruminococcaceae bacterium OttesenSCG-928-A11]
MRKTGSRALTFVMAFVMLFTLATPLSVHAAGPVDDDELIWYGGEDAVDDADITISVEDLLDGAGEDADSSLPAEDGGDSLPPED